MASKSSSSSKSSSPAPTRSTNIANVPGGSTVVLSPTGSSAPVNVPGRSTIGGGTTGSTKSTTKYNVSNVPGGTTRVLTPSNPTKTTTPRYSSSGQSGSSNLLASYASPVPQVASRTFSSGAAFTPSTSVGGGSTSYISSMSSGVNRSNEIVPVQATLSSNQYTIPEDTYNNPIATDLFNNTYTPPTPEEQQAEMAKQDQGMSENEATRILDKFFPNQESAADIYDRNLQESGAQDYGDILADTRTRIGRIKRTAEDEKRALDAEPISLGAKAGRMNEIDRKYAYELADLAIAEAAFSNRYEQALKYAEQRSGLEVEDQKYEQQKYLAQYLANRDSLTPAQRKLVEANYEARGIKIAEKETNNSLLLDQQKALFDQLNKGIDIVPGLTKAEQYYAIANAKSFDQLPAPQGRTSTTPLTAGQEQRLGAITSKYISDPILKSAEKAITTAAIADQVIANPQSASNQLKALYGFVKGLDPDSAVREGEVALAQLQSSYIENFSDKITRINKGRVISPKVAKQMAEATKELAQEWLAAGERQQRKYQAQANSINVGTQFSEFLNDFGGVSGGQAQQSQSLQQDEVDFLKSKGYNEQQIQQYIQQKSGRTSFNSAGLSKAIAKQESGGNYRAISPVGAMGKYQIMPKTLAGLGYNVSREQFLSSPQLQEEAHAKLVGQLASRYNGNLDKILADYYGGPNAAKVVGTPAGDRPQKGFPSINQYVAQVKSKLNMG